VVVASGSNAVLVYRFLALDASGRWTFALPVSYPVGTDPVSVTIADVNGARDSSGRLIPDMLVVNHGSNDVSVLYGSYDSNGHWMGTLGPRLRSGGSGPVAVNVLSDARSLGGLDLAII